MGGGPEEAKSSSWQQKITKAGNQAGLHVHLGKHLSGAEGLGRLHLGEGWTNGSDHALEPCHPHCSSLIPALPHPAPEHQASLGYTEASQAARITTVQTQHSSPKCEPDRDVPENNPPVKSIAHPESPQSCICSQTDEEQEPQEWRQASRGAGMGWSPPSMGLCGLSGKRGTPCLRNATSRGLKTATLCHYETPNTPGGVGFLKAYSAATEEP